MDPVSKWASLIQVIAIINLFILFIFLIFFSRKGVDYTHPALGGCFGKGCKVAYGYDLVGNDFDGSLNSIKPSHDPIDNCPTNSSKMMHCLFHRFFFSHCFPFFLASATGHGTFLAGVIAAEDKEYVKCLFTFQKSSPLMLLIRTGQVSLQV